VLELPSTAAAWRSLGCPGLSPVLPGSAAARLSELGERFALEYIKDLDAPVFGS
jgi:hypothetical protein